MTKSFRLKLLLLVGLFSVSLLCASLPAQAADKPAPGLQVYPLRSRPTQNPGDTTVGQINVVNNTAQQIDVSLEVQRFEVTDEDYNYAFNAGEHTDWVRLADKKINLQKGEHKAIAYSLAVPANASPGGYYFAIFASSQSQPSAADFLEVKRVASLVYLEVSGNIVRKLNMLGNDTPWFTSSQTVPVDSRIANQGNSHYEVHVKESVKSFIGSSPEPAIKDNLILPSTIRKVSYDAKLPGWPGIYKVSSSFSPPQGGPTEIASQWVIYIPIWAWFIIASALLWLTLEITALRRRNHHKILHQQ